MQDNLQDWQTESAKMASVYRDSLLKIAATASPDGGKGCFFERPPDGSIQVNYNETTLKETDAGCSLSNQLTHLSLLARQDSFMIDPQRFMRVLALLISLTRYASPLLISAVGLSKNVCYLDA